MRKTKYSKIAVVDRDEEVIPPKPVVEKKPELVKPIISPFQYCFDLWPMFMQQ